MPDSGSRVIGPCVPNVAQRIDYRAAEICRRRWQRLSARISLTGLAKYGRLQDNSLFGSGVDSGDGPPAFVGFKSGSLIVGRSRRVLSWHAMVPRRASTP